MLLIAFPASAQHQQKLENRPYADLKRWHLGFSVGDDMQDPKFTHNGYVTDDGQRWVAEVPGYSRDSASTSSARCASTNTSNCASAPECISATR